MSFKMKISLGVVGITVLLVVFNYIMPSCLRSQQKQINNLENTIVELKTESNPILFQILDKSNGQIVYKMLFQDEDGKKIATITDTIAGNELFFDFFNVAVNNKYIAFPDKIFSDAVSSANGKDLKVFYDKNNFPMVFYRDSLSEASKNALIELFVKVKNNDENIKMQFGNAVHDMDGVKSFTEGYTYKIITHTKGGIEIIED